jgi:uncharacterized RDD family membrane protein YckC
MVDSVDNMFTHGDLLGLASWWRRVLADLVDLTIIAVIANLLLLSVGNHTWWSFSSGYLNRGHNLIVASVASALAAFLYYPVLVWWTNGQTFGKVVFQIRVIRLADQRMTVVGAATREVGLKFLTIELIGLLPILGFGLGEIIFLADSLWPIWDCENRALHDMLARTRVVNVKGFKLAYKQAM